MSMQGLRSPQGGFSERRAWDRVLLLADVMRETAEAFARGQMGPLSWRQVVADAEELADLARSMTHQLAEGMHRNPPLLIHNPPLARGAGRGRIAFGESRGSLMGSEVEEIRYRHVQDQQWYKHAFEHPEDVQMIAMESPSRHRWIALLGTGVDLWKEF